MQSIHRINSVFWSSQNYCNSLPNRGLLLHWSVPAFASSFLDSMIAALFSAIVIVTLFGGASCNQSSFTDRPLGSQHYVSLSASQQSQGSYWLGGLSIANGATVYDLHPSFSSSVYSYNITIDQFEVTGVIIQPTLSLDLSAEAQTSAKVTYTLNNVEVSDQQVTTDASQTANITGLVSGLNLLTLSLSNVAGISDTPLYTVRIIRDGSAAIQSIYLYDDEQNQIPLNAVDDLSYSTSTPIPYEISQIRLKASLKDKTPFATSILVDINDRMNEEKLQDETLSKVYDMEAGDNTIWVSVFNTYRDQSTYFITVDRNLEPTPLPSTPSITSAIVSSDIRITWTSVNSSFLLPIGYELQRKVHSGDIWSTVYKGSSTSYADSDLEFNVLYDYRVSAFRRGGASAWSGTVTSARPASPQIELLQAVNSNRVSVQWTPVDQAVSYSLQRAQFYYDDSESDQESSYVWKDIASSLTTTEYYDNSVVSGTSYVYRVKTIGAVADSEWSSSLTVHIPYRPYPPFFGASFINATHVSFQWEVYVEFYHAIDGFIIYSSTDSFNYTQLYQVSSVKDQEYYEITFSPLSPGQRYYFYVEATNIAGSDQSNIEIVDSPAVPDAPFLFQIQPTSATSMLMMWFAEDPDMSPIISYNIKYKLADSTSAQWTEVNGITDMQYVVTGLGSSTFYNFSVQAVNTVGVGSWSNPVSATTPPPPDAPTCAAKVLSPRSIAIQITLPSNLDQSITPIFDFTIQQSLSSSGPWVMVSVVNQPSTIISGLNISTTYHYRASITSTSGSGAFSNPTSVTTPSLPVKPILAVSDATATSIILSWSAVASDVSFTIEMSNDNGANFVRVHSGVSGTSYPVSGLKPATQYRFRMTSSNQVGSSTSDVLSFSTYSLPAAPIGVSVTIVSATTATLSFVSSNTPSIYPVLSYRVSLRRLNSPTSSLQTFSFAPQNASTQSYLISNLQSNSVQYIVSVNAESAAGLGTTSSDITFTTPGTPNSVQIQQVKLIAGNQATLSWAAAVSSSAVPVSKYIVTKGFSNILSSNVNTDDDASSLSINQNDNEVVEVSSSTLSAIFNVQYNSAYTFTVVAINGVGSSHVNTDSSVTTINTPSIPTAPSNIQALVSGSSRVNLTWTASNVNDNTFAPLLQYVVQILRFDESDAVWTAAARPTSTSTMISNLTVGSYMFRVYGENIVGKSPSVSSGVVVIPPSGKPFIRSLNFVQSATEGSVSVKLQWSSPMVSSSDGSLIVDKSVQVNTYSIEIANGRVDVTSSNSFRIVASANSSTTTYRLDDLSFGTTYTFRVGMRTTASPVVDIYSPASVITTPSLPTAPTSVTATLVAPLRVRITWSFSSSSNLAPVLGYLLQSRANVGTQAGVWQTIYTGTSLSTEHDNLLGGATYSYRVYATNIAGNSVSSTIVQASTFVEPNAPSITSVTAASASSIMIAWSASSSQSSVSYPSIVSPISYSLQMRLSSSSTWSVVYNGALLSTTINSTEIGLGQTVYFRVSAQISSLSSTFSSTVQYVTANIPTKPRIQSISAISSSSISLTSSVPTTSAAARLISHVVEARASGSNTAFAVVYQGSDASVVLQNFSASTTYEFRNYWTNALGNSAYSAVVTARTFAPSPSTPQNVQVSQITSDNVVVSFTSPSNNGGSTVTAYRVEIRVSGNSNSFGPVYVGSNNQVTVKFLQPLTSYDLRVSARNQLSGFGDVSSTLSFTTSGKLPFTPSIPLLQDSASSSISISWGAVADYSSLPVLGYKILASTSSSSLSYVTSALTFDFSSLTSSTTYSFRLAAFNAFGTSAFGPALSVVTLPSVTKAPPSPTASSVTDTTLDLTVALPVLSTSTWSTWHYVISQSQSQSDSITTFIVPVGTNNRLLRRITGLLPQTAYNFMVSVRNDAGDSDFSQITKVATLSSGPSIISLIAYDPSLTNTDPLFHAGVRFNITFDQSTSFSNSNNELSKARIDAFLQFSSDTDVSTNADYVGRWTSDNRFILTFRNVSLVQNAPTVALTTVSIKSSAKLKNQDLTSAISTSTSAPLVGSYGVSSDYQSYLNALQNLKVSYTLSENQVLSISPLSFSSSLAQVIADAKLVLQLSCTYGTINNHSSMSFTFTAATLSSLATRQIIYKPQSYYYGSDILKVVLTVSGRTVYITQSSIHITAVNSPPSIQIPSSSSSVLANHVSFTTIFTFSQNKILDDPDVSSTFVSSQVALASIYSLYLETDSDIATMQFHSAVDSVIYSSSSSVASSYFELSGPLSALNQALHQLQVKSSKASISKVDISILLDDNGNIGTSSESSESSLTTSEIVSVSTACSSTTAAPQMTYAIFDTSLSMISVSFDQHVYTHLLPDHIDCASYFSLSSSSSSFFGEDNSCTFVDSQTLILELGSNANINVGDILALLKPSQSHTSASNNQTVYGIRSCASSNVYATHNVSVEAPPSVIVPSFSMVVPDMIGPCDDFIITVEDIAGVGTHAAYYSWSGTLLDVIGAVSSYDPDSDDSSDQLQPVSSSSPALYVRASLLQPGSTYTVNLVMSNFLQVSSSLHSSIVTISTYNLPNVELKVAKSMTVTTSQPLKLSADASATTCSTSTGTDLTLLYHWDVKDLTASVSATSLLSSVKTNTPDLVVPAYVLSASSRYLFTLTVSMRADPSISNVVSLEVNVLSSLLMASISGGDRLTVGRSSMLSLDASTSWDMDQSDNSIPSSAKITWRCLNLVSVPSLPCYNQSSITKSVITLPSTLQFSIPASTLSTGTYRFTVTIVSGSRTSTDSSERVIVNSNPPSVTIISFTPNVINSADAVKLQAQVIPSSSSSSSSLTYSWSIVDESTGNALNINMNDASLVNSWTQSSFIANVIARPIFTSGLSLRFIVQVKDTSNGQTTQASKIIRVRQGPSSGSFTVSSVRTPGSVIPSSLTAFSDVLALTASKFTTSAAPLRYSFYYSSTNTKSPAMISKNVYDVSQMLKIVGNSFRSNVYFVPAQSGDAQNNYQTLFVVKITDANGNSVYSTSTLTVLPADLEGLPFSAFLTLKLQKFTEKANENSNYDLSSAQISALSVYFNQLAVDTNTTTTTTSVARRLLSSTDTSASDLQSQITLRDQIVATTAATATATSSVTNTINTLISVLDVPAQVRIPTALQILSTLDVVINSFVLDTSTVVLCTRLLAAMDNYISTSVINSNDATSYAAVSSALLSSSDRLLRSVSINIIQAISETYTFNAVSADSASFSPLMLTASSSSSPLFSSVSSRTSVNYVRSINVNTSTLFDLTMPKVSVSIPSSVLINNVNAWSTSIDGIAYFLPGSVVPMTAAATNPSTSSYKYVSTDGILRIMLLQSNGNLVNSNMLQSGITSSSSSAILIVLNYNSQTCNPSKQCVPVCGVKYGNTNDSTVWQVESNTYVSTVSYDVTTSKITCAVSPSSSIHVAAFAKTIPVVASSTAVSSSSTGVSSSTALSRPSSSSTASSAGVIGPVPSGAVRLLLKLYLDYNAIDIDMFTVNLIQDLALNTGVSVNTFSFVHLQPGSVIALIDILSNTQTSPVTIFQQILLLSKDTNSGLYQGVVSRYLSPSDGVSSVCTDLVTIDVKCGYSVADYSTHNPRDGIGVGIAIGIISSLLICLLAYVIYRKYYAVPAKKHDQSEVEMRQVHTQGKDFIVNVPEEDVHHPTHVSRDRDGTVAMVGQSTLGAGSVGTFSSVADPQDKSYQLNRFRPANSSIPPMVIHGPPYEDEEKYAAEEDTHTTALDDSQVQGIAALPATSTTKKIGYPTYVPIPTSGLIEDDFVTNAETDASSVFGPSSSNNTAPYRPTVRVSVDANQGNALDQSFIADTAVIDDDETRLSDVTLQQESNLDAYNRFRNNPNPW